jgi:DNA-binding XRE family transcriptional regulator
MTRTTWAETRDARLPDAAARARYDAARQALDADLAAHRRTLRELRRARELTQTQLARSLRVSQAQVSRIETQADLYLSTLRTYVEAMGGELELRVVFGDGAWAEVEIAPGVRAVPEAPGVYRVVRVDEGPEVREVVPNPKGGWCVRKPGAVRPSAVAETKAGAVARAKAIVHNSGGGEVRVHEGRRAGRATAPARRGRTG